MLSTPGSRLRVVLDANVVVSALLSPEGTPGRILSAFLRQMSFELIVSPPILEEIRRVLTYPKVRSRLTASDQDLASWVRSLGVLADVVAGSEAEVSLPADPDDEIYLAAALEGRAHVLVSGDRHLLDLGRLDDVRILTPRAFLESLEPGA